MSSLSILVPVYNEQHLVTTSLDRLRVLESSPVLDRIQVVVVDDSSTDGTADVLAAFAKQRGFELRPPLPGAPRAGGQTDVFERGGGRESKFEWLFLQHTRNGGKGAAVKTALARASGEISIIHDADLEYHPKDMTQIVQVFIDERADAVFGSRFAGAGARRVIFFRHELGNRLLTFLTNLVSDLNLTDMETCYKAVRTELFRSIPIVSNDFRLEPELTIKLAKREARIFEVPISYSGRTYQEGKKIGWRDGVLSLGAITRFWLSDKIYTEDEFGSRILARLSRAPRFNAWMAETIRPFCGRRLLEIGSGTGNLTKLLTPRDRYVASDVNPVYLQSLRGLTAGRPYLDVTRTDVTLSDSFPRDSEGFDTVVCLNVIEHIDDDQGSLENLRKVMAPAGKAIVLVPQGPGLYGTLDEVLGHKRRYTRATLAALAEAAGFDVEHLIEFNRIGTPAWWLNGRVLQRRTFGLLQVLALNSFTPLFRLVDRALPFPALSLIAVLTPKPVPNPAASSES